MATDKEQKKGLKCTCGAILDANKICPMCGDRYEIVSKDVDGSSLLHWKKEREEDE